jgi:hypothetical protein
LQNCYFSPYVWRVGQVFGDWFVQIQFALLFELHNRDRSESLGNRADVPHRPGRRELVVLEVDDPIASRARDIGRLDDRHGDPRKMVLSNKIRNHLINRDAMALQHRIAAPETVSGRGGRGLSRGMSGD